MRVVSRPHDLPPDLSLSPRKVIFYRREMRELTGLVDYVTTPPMAPSSSPAPSSDMMDISPLPHKMPFVTQAEMYSPTPGRSQPDAMMLESPAFRQVSAESPKVFGAE